MPVPLARHGAAVTFHGFFMVIVAPNLRWSNGEGESQPAAVTEGNHAYTIPNQLHM